MWIKTIDMDTYSRRDHFKYFCSLAYPYAGTTANVDITELLSRARRDGQSIFLYLLYAAGNAANAVPEFRRRISAGGVIEYESCRTSHTVMKPDGTYAYCEADPSQPFCRFLEETACRQAGAREGGTIQEESAPDSLFFISCIPWLSYTSLVQPVPQPADSNPRITWGKYFEQDKKTYLPLSVLVHHALVDGKQIADFYQEMSACMDLCRL